MLKNVFSFVAADSLFREVPQSAHQTMYIKMCVKGVESIL